MSRATNVLDVAKPRIDKELLNVGKENSLRNTLFCMVGALAALWLALILYPGLSEIRAVRGQIVSQPASGFAWNSESGHVIAIELGETYSRVAVPTDDGQLSEMVPNEHRGDKTPSYVAYLDDEVVLGQKALDRAVAVPENVVFGVRRLIGRRFSVDPFLQSDIDALPYAVVNRDDKPTIRLHIGGHEKLFTPEQVQAEVIKKLKRSAESHLGKSVTHAVVTVPAYFADDQRQATRDAVRLAGLEPLRLINEPTAAGIGYGLDRKECQDYDCEEVSVVYDVAEQSLDVSVVCVETGMFEILATAGDRSLGGSAYDRAMLHAVVEKSSVGAGGELERAPDMGHELKAGVKYAEAVIATKASAEIQVGKFAVVITADDLRSVYEEVFNKSIKHMDRVLSKAKVNKSSISHILLTGPPHHVTQIQPFLEAFFDGKKIAQAPGGFSPDEAIIRGAAQQARMLSGIDDSGPTLGNFDLTVLSLGIETSNGLFAKIIPRNSMIPVRKAINITTSANGQSAIVLRVLQGERPLASDDRELGVLEMSGIPAGPAGEVAMEVAFENDVDDLLTVVVRLFGTNTEKRLVIDHLRQKQYKVADEAVFEAENCLEEDVERVREALAAEKTGEGELVPFGVALMAPVVRNLDRDDA